MRNFIVAFMLVILLSSIMFVILRPIQPTQVNNDKKEKSNVEKLLTEPSQTPQNSYHEMSSADKKEIIDEILQRFQKDKNEEKVQVEQKNIQQAQEVKPENNSKKETTSNNNQQQNPQEINLPMISNEQYKNLQKELIKKYGNNPNAEIPSEDVQAIFFKMLNQQQNN